MSSKKAKTKTTKKRPQRATSNVFAMFDQSQIQEFKEAFNMIDQNRDGFIDKEDLHDMLASLGFIQEDYLRELLTTMGDRFTDEEVDELYREAPIDKKGNFNYIEFTRILKHGAKDKDD
ncbi:myosin regulatory light chain 2, smooth muscle minor isoform-like isoform X2 [Numenius arquata]|uniref:myosin regulatory light chain 12B isoform X2 n=1 Tax=Acanthisitta chloris TaxID=57068 RepID=UPI0003833F82|nr:PREDICTED: myosin regulatory light chain 12B isoform X2 [Acanthisitta chloris]XP_009585358.1 PREDICTED: myosin regulatory light chain 12B-like isoform X2 [Fulmarus glacialis]XP_009708573.1 PREDICTED: myosin regulatory light chain 12B isoform X2 [Cariama cristata]XP_009870790.1 PREDICTED: myosin regulatory light chain 12B isoform X2 [Apaloderma vittatum]XP_009878270.1 PREDICTED: myosin regulatory light chain 12B isoform X2 [Charadrius vociferus]XP_009929729.1 PREDICTED: myosin regulatory lig